MEYLKITTLAALKNSGWKKLEVFEPGDEIMKLEVK